MLALAWPLALPLVPPRVPDSPLLPAPGWLLLPLVRSLPLVPPRVPEFLLLPARGWLLLPLARPLAWLVVCLRPPRMWVMPWT